MALRPGTADGLVPNLCPNATTVTSFGSSRGRRGPARTALGDETRDWRRAGRSPPWLPVPPFRSARASFGPSSLLDRAGCSRLTVSVVSATAVPRAGGERSHHVDWPCEVDVGVALVSSVDAQSWPEDRPVPNVSGGGPLCAGAPDALDVSCRADVRYGVAVDQHQVGSTPRLDDAAVGEAEVLRRQ